MTDESEFEYPASEQSRSMRNPLTMSMLFYVVTIGGILSASLRTLGGSSVVTTESLIQIEIIGIVLGVILGFGIGFFLFRKGTACVSGALLGFLVGAVAGGLALVEIDNFVEIAGLAFGGSWVLVVTMLLSSRLNTSEKEL